MSDRPELVGLTHTGVLAAIHGAAFPRDEVWSERAIAELLATPGVLGWLHPAGGMILTRVVADEAEILTLAVAPPVRRRGIARGLLGAAIAEFSRLGIMSVFLEVSAANVAARALYATLGFSAVGERPHYYSDGATALLMKFSFCE